MKESVEEYVCLYQIHKSSDDSKESDCTSVDSSVNKLFCDADPFHGGEDIAKSAENGEYNISPLIVDLLQSS